MPALVFGLGNPGPEYAATRHNVGHLVVDELARRAGGTLKSHKGVATAAQVRLGATPGTPAILGVSLGYMNRSGGPVGALAQYYGVDLDDLVVVHDELDLPFGTVRLKRGGGEGGHNGLKDITKAVGSRDYIRVRVGISRPPGRMDAAAYVLKPFAAAERKELPWVIDAAADAIEAILADGLEAAQLRFHSEN